MLIRTTIIWECHFQHRDIFVSPTACKTWCVHLALIPHRHKSGLWGVSWSFVLSTAKFLVTNFIPSHWPETSTKYFSDGWKPQVQVLLWCQGHSFILFLLRSSCIGFLGIFYRLARLSQGQPLTHLAPLICELERKGVWTMSLEDWLEGSRAPGSQQDSCPHDEDTTFTSLVNGKEILQG